MVNLQTMVRVYTLDLVAELAGRGEGAGNRPLNTEAHMVARIPTYISPERLQRLADASELRAALFASPKPSPVRRRSRQHPGGQPNLWRTALGPSEVSAHDGIHRASGANETRPPTSSAAASSAISSTSSPGANTSPLARELNELPAKYGARSPR
ncbi:hypothetical protein ACH4CE_36810 [Streptomyces gelaticus]|uniref:hypothetical protein n=1 Tax=Streptomyces gelaticus TaxID=285446 RepID=UPI0037968754